MKQQPEHTIKFQNNNKKQNENTTENNIKKQKAERKGYKMKKIKKMCRKSVVFETSTFCFQTNPFLDQNNTNVPN